jgi:hypothetical protein
MKHPLYPGYGGAPTSTIKYNIHQQWACKVYLHVLDVINRTTIMRLEPQQRMKRIGRIMDKLWFRFHTAHVRSVRITIQVRYQSI